MTTRIILQGCKSLKRVEGMDGYREVRPMLAADEHSVGIAYEIEGYGRWFKGTMHPRSILWYFRAMKLYERLPYVTRNGASVLLCFDAMCPVFLYDLPKKLEKLDTLFGSTKRTHRILVKARGEAPGPRQLARILKAIEVAPAVSIDDRHELIAATQNRRERPDEEMAKARLAEAALLDRAERMEEIRLAQASAHERALAATILPVTPRPRSFMRTLLGLTG